MASFTSIDLEDPNNSRKAIEKIKRQFRKSIHAVRRRIHESSVSDHVYINENLKPRMISLTVVRRFRPDAPTILPKDVFRNDTGIVSIFIVINEVLQRSSLSQQDLHDFSRAKGLE